MPFAKVRPPRSLRTRLLVLYLGAMALSASVVGLGVLVFARSFGEHLLASSVVNYTEAIAQHVQFDSSGRPTGLDETKIERWIFTSLREEVALRIVDAQGRVIYPQGSGESALAPEGSSFDPARRGFVITRGSAQMHAATAPVPLPQGQSGQPTWYLQFALSDRLALQVRQGVGLPALLRGIGITAAVFLVVFLVTTHFTLRRALAPLRDASQEARRITPRTLDARLATQGLPSEIEPLVEAFNRALERLQQGFRTQQEFLASAAHELKTPLALIRAQVELGSPEQRDPNVIHDVDRMARQIQQLLMLAEASEPQNYEIEPIDPRATIHEVFDYMARIADRRTVHLYLRMDEEIGVWNADRGALFTLLKNLLENAIQHSPPGGFVTLRVQPGGFVVADEGPGVPAEHMAKIFERFWRSAERRDEGAGLGLAICREIAAAHQWQLEARPGAVGLELHVRFSDRP